MYKKFALLILSLVMAGVTFAQDNGGSSAGVVRRRANDARSKTGTNGVTQRMQQHFAETPVSDSELQWMRVMYRQLDLTKDENGALYFPDEPVEGQDNLFRIILKNLASGDLTAYEYLDGREMFTPDFKVKMRDVLDRFHIIYTNGKGSTEKNPKFNIDDSDIPASEVLSYYIIEKWEFDKRSNRMRSSIDAICPVLHRSGDFGGEAIKYPMFWVKYSDLRPYLSAQNIFTDDDNNLATCTYDDFFQMGKYKGDIYKTRNLKNKSLMQMYPDPEDLAKAQDSIQKRLDTFEQKLWVPSLDELAQRRSVREGKKKPETESSTAAVAEEPEKSSEPAERTQRSKRGSVKSKPAKVSKPKAPKSSSSSSSSGGAARSVRNRKR